LLTVLLAVPLTVAAPLLPPLPLWTDRYAKSATDQGVRLDIDAVMASENFTRAEAVEVQNQLRDALRTNPGGDVDLAYESAVAAVRAGAFEGRFAKETLDTAPFVVVFDLDETLIDQAYPTEVAATCASFRYRDGDRERAVQLAPGWEVVFDTIRDAGGAIVIDSANLDARVDAILSAWTWEGVPLKDHPAVAAWVSNSHLVQQAAASGRPVLEPSKDLRGFDASLDKVLLVDDNPLRVFQFANLRLPPKFQAERWCGGAADVRAMHEAVLPGIAAEIEDALSWQRQHGGTFADAYRPYTALGRLAVDAADAALPGPRSRAVVWVREHPETVERDF
jgi:hypothetical protein